MFLKGDIYTSSGALKLYHCWTDKVTKFDSSAFYNWEQDNMPVYDLEERTYYLWEKLGYPTSSIPGVALVVSADASDNDVQCNKNIFRTVSAAIEALPQTINFPIIIEVANFGQLGDLVLDNYKFGSKGSLEIINRNFAKADTLASATFSSTIAGGPYTTRDFGLNFASGDLVTGNTYNYLSSNYIPGSFALFGLEVDFNPRYQFRDSSCLSISSTVFSSITDQRLINNLNGFVSLHRGTADYGNAKLGKSTLIVDSKNTMSPYAGGADFIAFKSYDLNSDSFESISTYDVSTIDNLNSNSHLYLNAYSDKYFTNLYQSVTNIVPSRGVFFGNKFNKVVISNCDGPIYLRNFFLDGSGANKTGNNVGVEVDNCTNVYLENMVSTRYRKAGFLFNNSKVNLLRGCVATRIYDFDSANVRLTGLWNTKRKLDIFNSAKGYPNLDESAGIISNNSFINVSSTREFEVALQQAYISNRNSSYTGGFKFIDFLPHVNANYIFESSKNANGIILNNSVLTGGDITQISSIAHFYNHIAFDIYNNTGYGIKSSNSKISFDGRFNVYENLKGITLDSSLFEIDKLSLLYNQRVGLECNNSNVIYNKNLAPYVNAGSNYEGHQPLYFNKNGQHIVLNNSMMNPMITSAMDSLYDIMPFDNSIGVKGYLASNEIIPAIEITNNSELVLISPYLTRDANHSVGATPNLTCKGSELSVTNNSKANLKGARYGATRIFGPAGRDYHKNMAGAYAGDRSTIELNGPTVVAQYGIDLFAENYSNININPHGSKNGLELDVSAFNLTNKLNHTAVELHSTRSCVVVDNHSTFNARDLGSFKRTWDTTGSYYTTLLANSGIDYVSIGTIEPYVSAGSLQFYPNPIPITSYNDTTFPGKDSITPLTSPKFTANTNPGLYYLRNQDTTQNFDYSAVTNGGFCVRALNNSLVNVHNVNFPCGWWNCSGTHYDNTVAAANGGLCYKTFIWNIADNSQLKSSYLSVSGLYPRAAGYVGPSGFWASGASKTIASGLPVGTPDTSSVSILDYFGGSVTSINPYGKTSAQNYGPFRLYFSVNPVANALTDINSNNYAPIQQIYSQGYQPSSNLMCSGGSASSLYVFTQNKGSGNTVVASGYYYGSSMMDNAGFIRVFIDESSAETFANAKHCAVGKSGNAKLVSIYYPYTTTPLGSSNNTLGIKSINLFDLQRDN